MNDNQKNGRDLVEDEHRRQITHEGYASNTDAAKYRTCLNGECGGHTSTLALAAHCYEINNSAKWPWDKKHWKNEPANPVRRLVKSGAMYLAEANRLDYLKKQEKNNHIDYDKLINQNMGHYYRVIEKIDILLDPLTLEVGTHTILAEEKPVITGSGPLNFTKTIFSTAKVDILTQVLQDAYSKIKTMTYDVESIEKGEDRNFYQELFDYLADELNCTPLESQMSDIYHICDKQRIAAENNFNALERSKEKIEAAFIELVNKKVPLLKIDKWFEKAGINKLNRGE